MIQVWDKENLQTLDIDAFDVAIHNVVSIKQNTKHLVTDEGEKFTVKSFIITDKDGVKTTIKAFS